MDTVFVTNVPDLATWGNYSSTTPHQPRRHTADCLDVNIARNAQGYSPIVHGVARSIASGRLTADDLTRWERAVQGQHSLTVAERTIIARALARGIVQSGANPVPGRPPINTDHFKGHVVEVILFCMRVHLHRAGTVHPVLFQPRKPKACSASGGIDLLEVGQSAGNFYLHIWECKGTENDAGTAFTQAARQLCKATGTAYQSFMEAHRALQDSPEVQANAALDAFVNQMPHLFYDHPPRPEKRLGGVVGCHRTGCLTDTACFAAAVANSADGPHPNCHALVVRFADFPTFLTDLYARLWSIY